MLDLLGACDSEPKQPNAILNLIVIFPLACPKSQKQQKRNPPPGGGVPFWHFFFMDVFSRAKAQPSSRTGLGEAEESGRSLLHESLACSTVLHSECATFEHLTEMECTWRFASTMNSTKSGLSYETSCFGAMIKSKQATKVYFPAMVFKKWEQDCTLVSMLVTLLHLHQREPPTHTKYNHFFHLAKNAWCKEKQSKPAWPQSTQREAGWHSTSGLTMSHKLLWCICAWQQGQNVCWRKKSSLAI